MSNSTSETFHSGIGVSTQSASCVTITGEADLISISEVNYGDNFSELFPELFKGGYGSEGQKRFFTNPYLFMYAIDALLYMVRLRLGKKGVGKVRSMASSVQQHGAWLGREGLDHLLLSLNQASYLGEQLTDSFYQVASHWMDQSTGRECELIHEFIGRDDLLQATGSTAQMRFLLCQLLRWNSQGKFDEYKHVGLLNSLVTSLLTGRIAPIGIGDALGTNAVSLETNDWWSEGLEKTGLTDIIPMLPKVVPSNHFVGNLAGYFTRYGFVPSLVDVFVGEGDNCDSVMDCQVVVDLGSSNTLMIRTEKPVIDPSGRGSVFGSAFGGYITLFMPPYGSLHQNAVRDRCCKGKWSTFDNILDRANNRDILAGVGPLMIPDDNGFQCTKAIQPGESREVVGCVRGLLADLVRRADFESVSHIVVNGDAAKPPTCQILADMTNAVVEQSIVQDGPALGAAIRAAKCHNDRHGEAKPYSFYTDKLRPIGRKFHPRQQWVEFYRDRYMPAFNQAAPPIAG